MEREIKIVVVPSSMQVYLFLASFLILSLSVNSDYDIIYFCPVKCSPVTISSAYCFYPGNAGNTGDNKFLK